MDLFTSPLEDEEMSLRELAMPSMEDIEMQKFDLTFAATHYEVKPRIIKLVATKPFRGLEDDNPYRHINEFTMICNTVQQEGVPATWFKWNLFPFSLQDEAGRWYTLASVEAKGNWDELVKKFLLKFFPISKVQDLRRQQGRPCQFGGQGHNLYWGLLIKKLSLTDGYFLDYIVLEN
jgi:hypothetical protein